VPEGWPVAVKEDFEGEKAMKSQNESTNVESTPKIILRSHVPGESGKNEPPLAEIRQRAFEIHIERGGIHGCDLDDWLQAQQELKEKYNRATTQTRRRNEMDIKTVIPATLSVLSRAISRLRQEHKSSRAGQSCKESFRGRALRKTSC
jgi:hypothetical protein